MKKKHWCSSLLHVQVAAPHVHETWINRGKGWISNHFCWTDLDLNVGSTKTEPLATCCKLLVLSKMHKNADSWVSHAALWEEWMFPILVPLCKRVALRLWSAFVEPESQCSLPFMRETRKFKRRNVKLTHISSPKHDISLEAGFGYIAPTMPKRSACKRNSSDTSTKERIPLSAVERVLGHQDSSQVRILLDDRTGTMEMDILQFHKYHPTLR